MKNIFKLSNLIPILLIVYITKSFIIQPGFFDFTIVTLMSFSFLYKLKLDKDIITDKQELIDSITHFEEEVNKKVDEFRVKYDERLHELQKTQDNDRLAAENKFSTLNLGLQRQSRKPQEKSYNGWGS